MTATTGVGRERAGRAGIPPPARDRRRGWVALAVALVIGVGVLGGVEYQQAGAKTSIVVVAANVPTGHVITRADLTTVNVAGPLTSIAGRDLGRVVGRRAAVTLLAGMPVQQAMLSTAADLQPGQAQVGLAVSAGQVPADGVRAGDTVEVLQLPGTGGGVRPADPASVLVQTAVVWSVHADPARAGGFLLTVTVPGDLVGDLVSASGAGQVAVARVVTEP